MTAKGWLLCVGAALLVIAGLFMYRDHARAKVDQAHVQQAAVDQSAAKADAKQGDDHAAQAQQIATTVQADDAAVSRLSAAVARLRPAAPRAPLPPAVPGMPEPQPVAPGVELDQTKDALIAAQAKEITDLKAQNAQLVLADQAHRAAYVQDDAAVGELKQAIHPSYRRAAGLLYGPGQSAVGVFVEQDIARVRVNVSLIQQGLPALAGGRNQTLALIGAAVTF